jgi:hypothetical protein
MGRREIGRLGDREMGRWSDGDIHKIRLKVLVAERCKIIAIPVLAKEVNVGCNSGHMPYICKVFTLKVEVRFYQS